MLLHTSPLFQIYFGDAADNLFNPVVSAPSASRSMTSDVAPCKKVATLMNLTRLIFLKQQHGADGVCVDQYVIAGVLEHEGDYLITNQKRIGLGVLTADCLPIVLYDPVNSVVAAIHAGWRGTVLGIAQKALQDMQQKYGTQARSVQVFFGPSAKPCCYTIGKEVMHELEDHCAYYEQIVHTQQDGVHFDLPGYNRIVLQQEGVPPEAFHLEYNFCTIGDPTFFSYRRQADKAGRQMTIVALR